MVNMSAGTFQFSKHSGKCFTKCIITKNNQNGYIRAKNVNIPDLTTDRCNFQAKQFNS